MDNSQGFSTMSSEIANADNYNRWILDCFQSFTGNNLLEIGTGQGNFSRYLTHIKSYVSIDIDAEIIHRAQHRNPQGVYIQADISNEHSVKVLSTYSFDTIICFNVLEHIPKAQSAVNNMLSLLIPGGHLLLLMPAFQGLYSEMDKMAGHVKRYRKRDIYQLVNDRQQIKKIRYFNAIGGLGWYVNKFFHHKDLDSRAINQQIKVFDRYIVPIAKRVDRLTHPFFGQSVICAIQKE